MEVSLKERRSRASISNSFLLSPNLTGLASGMLSTCILTAELWSASHVTTIVAQSAVEVSQFLRPDKMSSSFAADGAAKSYDVIVVGAGVSGELFFL